jgi:hypothetical protein
MKILVVDSLPVACSTLARELNKTLRYEALCASSTAESLRFLQIEKDAITVIVHSLEMGPDAGISFIQTIREFCIAASIRVPRFVVLSPGPLTGRYIKRFRILNAVYLLHGFVQQVCETVKELIDDALCEKGRPTILVDRLGPASQFSLLGAATSELIRYGPRVLPMMNFFAIHFGTELSTLTLAEVADITAAYVRVYMGLLRAGFDQARVKVGVEIPGREVFCTFRRDGAHVHVLRARVLFN